jgi:hypothetical protein
LRPPLELAEFNKLRVAASLEAHKAETDQPAPFHLTTRDGVLASEVSTTPTAVQLVGPEQDAPNRAFDDATG